MKSCVSILYKKWSKDAMAVLLMSLSRVASFLLEKHDIYTFISII